VIELIYVLLCKVSITLMIILFIKYVFHFLTITKTYALSLVDRLYPYTL